MPEKAVASGGVRRVEVVAATLLVALVALQGCAMLEQVVRVEEADSLSAIELNTGQVLEIRLPSYQNQTIALGSVVGPTLSLDGTPTLNDDPIRDGVSGTAHYEAWRFRAVQPGRAVVRMDYRRPWQATGEPNRSITYNVTVQ